MPSRPIPIRRRKTRNERYRESATWDEIPPLFDTTAGTRALAMIFGSGAATIYKIHTVSGMGVAKYQDTVHKYADLGLLSKHKILALRGFPVVYALNRKHEAYPKFYRLMDAIWNQYLRREYGKLRWEFRMPVDAHQHANGAEELYKQRSRHGEILHLLAEFDGPVEQIALCELLGRQITVFYPLITRLTAFGLVTDRYANLHRWVQFNNKHPVVTPLRAWLRYVNEHHARRYVELREKYYATQREGGYDRTTRMRRNKAARAHGVSSDDGTEH